MSVGESGSVAIEVSCTMFEATDESCVVKVDSRAAVVHGRTSFDESSETPLSGRANAYVLSSFCRRGVVFT